VELVARDARDDNVEEEDDGEGRERQNVQRAEADERELGVSGKINKQPGDPGCDHAIKR